MVTRAFGIDVESDFPLAVLPPAGRPEGEPTRVRTAASVAELDAGWPAAEAERVEELRAEDGTLGLGIDHHPEAGYRLDAGVFGTYRVSGDGMRADCAFSGAEPWRRERYVTARVLPLAATLRGLEVLHAGSVAVGGGALAFLGHSHAGKTSLTVQMVLRGASILTDDLLALELRGGAPRAHPGAPVAGIRLQEYELLADDDLACLGAARERGGKMWVAPERAPGPLPLRAVYLLVRDPHAEALEFELLPAPDPRLLLSASFFSQLALTPHRLANQLTLCAAIAGTVPVVRTVVPGQVGAASLADRICEREGIPRRRACAA